MIQDPVLVNDWHPIARSDALLACLPALFEGDDSQIL